MKRTAEEIAQGDIDITRLWSEGRTIPEIADSLDVTISVVSTRITVLWKRGAIRSSLDEVRQWQTDWWNTRPAPSLDGLRALVRKWSRPVYGSLGGGKSRAEEILEELAAEIERMVKEDLDARLLNHYEIRKAIQ